MYSLNRRNFIIGSSFVLSASPTVAASNKYLTIDYGPSELDIYSASSNSLRPVMLFVHGGAWQIGSRRDVDVKPAFFEKLGYLFVSLDYRLFPFVKPVRQVDDIVAAYIWLRSNISKYGGDPLHIVAMGHSAGCHLLALATLSGRLPGLAGLICNDIQMYDIAKFAAARGGTLPFHYALAFSSSSWSNLSPATFVGQYPVPPILVAYSSMEHSQDMSLDFVQRLIAAGVSVTVFDGSAYKHRAINRDIGHNQGGISAAIEGFLAAYHK